MLYAFKRTIYKNAGIFQRNSQNRPDLTTKRMPVIILKSFCNDRLHTLPFYRLQYTFRPEGADSHP